MLQHNSNRVLNKVEQGPDDDDGTFKTNSWAVAEAVKHGYILKDYNLIDYIETTWQGLSTDPPHPVDPAKKRTRFHLINVWGEQGASKTSFVAQLAGLAYGAYEDRLTIEERRAIWRFVQQIVIVNRTDLRRVAEMVKNPNQRFKLIILDDINSIIPRQLAWMDRDLYQETFTLLGMIRRKAGCIVTTEPNIEMLIEAFKEVMSIEVIVYPNSSYKVERMCHDIHPYYRAQDKLTKIIVEDPDHGAIFNPYDTPTEWWDEYQARTNDQGQEAWDKTIARIAKLEESAADKDKEERESAEKAIKRGSTREIAEKYRAAGGKMNQHDIEKIVHLVKAEQMSKLKNPELVAQE
jgi:hypothetical protein